MSLPYHYLTSRPRFDAAWKDLCKACMDLPDVFHSMEIHVEIHVN